MRATGNGNPQLCVQNLLKTVRGEVPFERLKGLDRTLIDRPSSTARADLVSDVQFVIETYEPRVNLSSTELNALAAQTGGFELKTTINNLTQ